MASVPGVPRGSARSAPSRRCRRGRWCGRRRRIGAEARRRGARLAAEDGIAVERDRDDEGVDGAGPVAGKRGKGPVELAMLGELVGGARFCDLGAVSARALISGGAGADQQGRMAGGVTGRLVRLRRGHARQHHRRRREQVHKGAHPFAHRRKTPSGAAQVKPGYVRSPLAGFDPQRPTC